MIKNGRSVREIRVLKRPELIADIATGETAYKSDAPTVSQRLSERRRNSRYPDPARRSGAKRKSAVINSFTLPKNGSANSAIIASQVGADAEVPIPISCQPLK